MDTPLSRLRRLPPKGTPPVARQSRFHGGAERSRACFNAAGETQHVRPIKTIKTIKTFDTIE